MGRRRKPDASDTQSGPGTRALKWVGAVAAVISLLLGARQLTTWVGDTLQRRREAATQIELARQQASRGAFADAWASLDRAEKLQPGEAVDTARIETAFAWLQEARPGPGKPFSAITDPVTPALDRALVTATGRRRADLLAHLGWVTYLRVRDGAASVRDGGTVDPAARYREALAVDPSNVYANAMLGHWLMWRGGDVDTGRQHYQTAVTAAGDDTRPFVRSLQLASAANRGEDGDAELIRVADDMRQRGEPIERLAADRVYHAFRYQYRPRRTPPAHDPGLAPANLEATFDWIVKTSPAASRSAEVETVRGWVRAGGGSAR